MSRILMLIALFLLAGVSAAAQTVNTTVTVNCDRGESLNQALAKLNKRASQTVNVKGTCAEYVQVRGFEGLTLKGLPGATLVQPIGPPATGIFAVLTIDSSRGVTVDGFKVQAPQWDFFAILVWRASADLRLRNLITEGGAYGIIVGQNSQVSIARVTGRDPGYATVGAYDSSDVFLEDSLFEGHTAAGFWNAGIVVGKGTHLLLHGTTIRNMQEGMVAERGGIIDVSDFNSYFPFGGPSEVVIENPLGTNFYGLRIIDGGIVTLGTKLRITNAGQPWGGDSGGVVMRGGGTLNAGSHLEVSGSQGQGVYVTNNSQVTLVGSSITGSLHNGLVVLNQSTVAAGTPGPSNPPTQISGNNRKDVFCDSRSLITGGANIANATSVECSNLLAGASEPIP